MKKLLALLLAGLMLFGFGVVGAAQEGVPEAPEGVFDAGALVPQEAQEPEAEEVAPQVTPEEELEAEGRALLMQTMEDLRGEYSFGSVDTSVLNYWKVMHKDGAYVFRRYTKDGNNNELHIGNEKFLVYPDRNAYLRVASLPSSVLLPLLEPKEITEDTPLVVSPDGAIISVSCDGTTYKYRSNGLYSISRSEGLYISGISLSKDVDASLLSINGLQVTSKLQVWSWGIRDYMIGAGTVAGGLLSILLLPLTIFFLIIPGGEYVFSILFGMALAVISSPLWAPIALIVYFFQGFIFS